MNKIIPLLNRWFILIFGVFLLLLLLMIVQNLGILYLQHARYQAFHPQLSRIKHAHLIEAEQKAQLESIQHNLALQEAESPKISSHIAFVEYVEGITQELGLLLISLPQLLPTSDQDPFLLAQCEVQGSFHAILQLIYQLEEVDRLGAIHTCTFEQKVIRIKGKRTPLLTAQITLRRLSASSIN